MEKSQVLEALHRFIAQKPGLEFANYGDITTYRSEMRSITKDRHEAEHLLAAVSWRDSITADDLVKAAEGAFSGRLTITEKDGKAHIDYCTGQYWPTEYRKAACAVLASALWNYTREHAMPAVNGTTSRTSGVGCFATTTHDLPAIDGKTPGDWLRDRFKKEFGRAMQKRWFD